MTSRLPSAPIVVLTEAHSDEVLAVNGLHVLTFKPSGSWTVITLRNGNILTVAEHFEDVLAALSLDSSE